MTTDLMILQRALSATHLDPSINRILPFSCANYWLRWFTRILLKVLRQQTDLLTASPIIHQEPHLPMNHLFSRCVCVEPDLNYHTHDSRINSASRDSPLPADIVTAKSVLYSKET